MNNQDWKQLAQDDLDEFERRENAMPHWTQKIVMGLMVVGIGFMVVSMVYMGFALDKVYMEWQLNR